MWDWNGDKTYTLWDHISDILLSKTSLINKRWLYQINVSFKVHILKMEMKQHLNKCLLFKPTHQIHGLDKDIYKKNKDSNGYMFRFIWLAMQVSFHAKLQWLLQFWVAVKMCGSSRCKPYLLYETYARIWTCKLAPLW